MRSEPFHHIHLYKRIVQAKLFIDAHYHEEIDTSNIASEAHISKFHFIRIFKGIYGRTPHHYLTWVRMEKAKELLAKGKPVLDVCHEVGFDSPTSFTALFKKASGITPSAFAHRMRQRQLAMRSNPLTFIPNCFAETGGWTKNSNFEEVLV